MHVRAFMDFITLKQWKLKLDTSISKPELNICMGVPKLFCHWI